MAETMDNDCFGVLGFLFGHRFTPRFSEESSKRPETGVFDAAPFVSLTGDAAVEFTKQRNTSKRTYHGDVCSRCGKVLKLRRVPPTPGARD